MQSYDGDIRLSVLLDAKEATKQIDTLRKEATTAVSSVDPKIAQLGNSMLKAIDKVDRLSSEMRKLADTKIPTEEYTNVSSKLEEAYHKLLKLREERNKMIKSGKSQELTAEYKSLLDQTTQYYKDFQKATNAWKKAEGDANKQAGLEVKMNVLKKSFDSSREALAKLENEGKKYKDTQEFSEKLAEIEKYKAQLNNLISKRKELRDTEQSYISGTETEAYKKLSEQLQYASNSVGIYKKKLAENNKSQQTFKSSVKSSENYLKSFKKALVSGAGALKTVNSGVRNAVKGLKQGATAFKGFGNTSHRAINKLIKSFVKWGLGLRGIFTLYRKLRGYAADALNTMAQQVDEVNADMEQIKRSFNLFKGSLGTMIQPLVSALVPAITTILNLFSQAAVAVGMFFAEFTGQGYVYKAVDAQEELADATKKSSKAQKELNKSLAAYDKLLVIPSQDDKKPAGGGAGATKEQLPVDYQKVDVTEKIKNLVADIKEAWNKADFTDLGKRFGQKIIEGLRGINWDGIQEIANKVAKSLATFLNGAISPQLFSTVANTLGKAFYTVLGTLNTFADNFDWKNLGKSIASGINSFFTNFKFAEVAKTITKFANGIFNTLYTAFKETNWEKIGNNIGDGISTFFKTFDAKTLGKSVGAAINGIFTLLSSTIKKTDFKKIAKSFTDFINGAIGEFDPKSVSDTLNGAVKGIFTFLNETIKNTDWKEIGTKIINFILNIDWLGIMSEALKTVGSIAEACADLAEGILTEIINAIDDISSNGLSADQEKQLEDFMATIIETLGKVLGAGGKIAGLLLKLVIKLIGLIIDEMSKGINTIIDTLSDDKKREQALEDIGEWFVEDICGGIVKGSKDVGEWSSTYIIEPIVDGYKKNKPALKKLGDMGLDILAKIMAKSNVTTAKAVKWIQANVVEPIEGFFKDPKGAFKSCAEDIWHAISNAPILSDIGEWVSDHIIEPLVNGIKDNDEIKNGDVGKWIIDKIKEGITGVTSGIGDWVADNIITPIVGTSGVESPNSSAAIVSSGSWISSTLLSGISKNEGKLKQWFSDTFGDSWGKVKEKFSTKNVSEHFGSVWTKIKEKFSDTKSWFGTKFGDTWTKIKEKLNLKDVGKHFSDLFDKVTSPFKDIAKWFKEKFSKAWENVKGVFSEKGKIFDGIKSGIESTFRTVVNKLIKGINTIVAKPFEKINEMINDLKSISVAGVKPFESVFKNFKITVPKIPEIPKLAKGAVIPPNREFMAVLGDQKRGTNIETPLETMVQAFKMALGDSGAKEPIQLYLDGKVVAQVVWDEEEKKYKQTNNFRFA